MKDYVVLGVIGLSGFLLASLGKGEIDLNAIAPALVSAYASIRIAQIKADAEKHPQPPTTHEDPWLNVVLWVMLITTLIALVILVGVILVTSVMGSVSVG
jgi:hypothetical protein